MSLNRSKRGPRVRRAVTLLLLVLAAPSGASGQDVPSEAEVKEQCKLVWDSLQTLYFECDEFNLDDGGEPDYGPGYNRFEFWQAPGGKRAMISRAIHPDREELATTFRQDGRRRYEVSAYPGSPDVTRGVAIRHQPDSADYYEGVMNSVLWLLMPAGKPVHVHIEEGAEIKVDRPGPDDLRIEVISEHRGRPLRIVLDPLRDWMPKEIIHEGILRLVATKYDRDGGRWFPIEGRKEAHRRGGVQHSGFQVVRFRINGPVPSSAFGMPEIEEGVVVTDATGKTTRSRVVGGEAAKLARDRIYTPVEEEPATGIPLIVPRQGERSVLYYSVVSLGAFALLAAFVLHLRRRLGSSS